ncbi:MAG TPA: glycerol-3-phosphate 1-O-acyltransferase PlsY [Candidatus Binatia bacterium]
MEALLVICSYLLGSVPSGLIIGKLSGLDVRKAGSGNIGATNVARLLGKKVGFLTLVADTAKGLVPVLLAQQIGLSDPISALVGIAAFLGHVYPIFLKFKGGKGVATGFGVLLGLAPLATIILLVIFAALAFITRIVSLSSMVSAVAAPLVLWLFHYSPTYITMAALIAIIIVFRHYANIQRLLNGTEPRFSTR